MDGRPLYAAHAGLPVPEAPHLALWHACTLLREHRFDGHIAALTVSGLDGLDALVIASRRGFRHGSGDDSAHARLDARRRCDAAAERLRRRGLLDADNALTAEGRALKSAVEEMTDNLAPEVWETLDGAASARGCSGMLRRLATLLEHPDGITYPNPIGVSRPV